MKMQHRNFLFYSTIEQLKPDKLRSMFQKTNSTRNAYSSDQWADPTKSMKDSLQLHIQFPSVNLLPLSKASGPQILRFGPSRRRMNAWGGTLCSRRTEAGERRIRKRYIPTNTSQRRNNYWGNDWHYTCTRMSSCARLIFTRDLLVEMWYFVKSPMKPAAKLLWLCSIFWGHVPCSAGLGIRGFRQLWTDVLDVA